MLSRSIELQQANHQQFKTTVEYNGHQYVAMEDGSGKDWMTGSANTSYNRHRQGGRYCRRCVVVFVLISIVIGVSLGYALNTLLGYFPCSSTDGMASSNCSCNQGHCDQSGCTFAVCNGGHCYQAHATKAFCAGGHCNQASVTAASCVGGYCNQRHAVRSAMCTGGSCWQGASPGAAMSCTGGSCIDGSDTCVSGSGNKIN